MAILSSFVHCLLLLFPRQVFVISYLLTRCGQCSRHRHRPAGQDNDNHSQNNMSDLNLSKETLDQSEIHSENCGEQSQNRHNNQSTAEKSSGWLKIERLYNFALHKSKCRSSPAAGRARQAGPLFEAARTKPPFYVHLALLHNPQQSKKASHNQKSQPSSKPLSRRCTADKFSLI